MPKSDTKSAALSRLFGNKPGTDGAGERREETSREQPHKATPEASGNDTPAIQNRTSRAAPEETALEEANAAPVQAPASKEPPASPERTDEDQEGEGSGYLGSGRYRRTTGVLERITPYVRPDQAEALRVAVALRNDPRGSDISAIIQSLLDEAGYQGGES